MEHSKGKLKAEQGIGRQYFLEDKDNNTVALVALRANAHHLVTCWNDHDTLKAKADLHDELVKELENSTGQMRLITGFDQERKRRIETLLAKCKEIT